MTITIDLLTLFPKMAEGYLEESMLGKAIKNGKLSINVHNIRTWAKGKHSITDDRPFGGGPGMVMKPEPIFECIKSIKNQTNISSAKVIYLCPDGIPLKTNVVKSLANESHLILLSGHYEGVDQRVRDSLVDQEISIGDYVLTNGTLPSLVLIDAISRHISGVLGCQDSTKHDSFNDNLLSFPQYTRPKVFQGMNVPEILFSGNHKSIESWRKEQQILKTSIRRKDLLSKEKSD